jgi:hypothetical protein
MSKKDLKIFFLAFFAFLLANYFYNNITSDAIAKGITFKEVTVKLKGEVQLDLDCKGEETINPPQINRGTGSQLSAKCVGKGNFTAEFPQQRFVENPDEVIEKK